MINTACNFVTKEIILRGVLQEAFSQGFTKAYKNEEVTFLCPPIQSASLVGVVATSILFGISRAVSGAFISYVACSTLSSIVYGILAIQYGFTSADILRMLQTVKRSHQNYGCMYAPKF